MMAKMNYAKYLPKAGSTLAVAMAMTVALSTQASATELNGEEPLNTNPPVDENQIDADLNLDGMEPAEANAAIDEANKEVIGENQETADENRQTQQENNEAAENNESSTNGDLTNPELTLPDAPEAPNTEGMDVEEHNQAVGEYNGGVDEYNDAANAYNDQVDGYNNAADDYDRQAQESYEQEKGAYDREKEAHDAAAEAYAKYEAELAAYEAEKTRLEEEYRLALEAYNKARTEHSEQSEAYAKYEAELAAYETEKTRLEEEHRLALEAYNERLQASEAAWKAYNEYLARQEAYQTAQKVYEAQLKLYKEDFEQYLQSYLERNGAEDAAYQEYLAAKAEYEQALALYNAYVKENTIFTDVTEYNQNIDEENGKIDDLNESLSNDVDGNVDSISGVRAANRNLEVSQETLDILAGYSQLAREQAELEQMGAQLESHPGKDAENLASQAYADYLAAVEAYNAAVETVNDKIDAYNKAVTEYNEAVNAYNETHKNSTSSSTDETVSTGTADWGNFGRQNFSFNHIDVRYQAAAVKNKIEDTTTGEVTYSDSVSKYDIVGVYYDQSAATENSGEFGITYTNTRGQEIDYEMTKDDDHNEFCTASTDRQGNIDRTDASANKNTVVTFYATLNDGQGISIKLDANSVYADNSYYLYDSRDHLHEFRDSSGKALPIVTIDGQRYYDVSGQSVYLISALACDGYAYRLGGLDLILNMQTIIEIYQADKAQTVSYLDFQKGKTAQIAAPTPVEEPDTLNVDMLEPTEPTPPNPETEPEVFDEIEPQLNLPKAPDPVNDPGDFEEIEPQLNLPKAPDPVNDPGDFEEIEPQLNLPKAPEPVNDPGAFDKTEPQAPTPTHRLDHVGKLDKLTEKLEIVIPPVGPGPNPDPNPEPEPPAPEPVVIIEDDPVPLADVPKTGDISALWTLLSGLSAGGIFLVNKKRK